ncbi:NAD(P)-dependent oxidoreductase [Haladaptatus cibarius]|uniref:NAD(P)-dependent oxidoreductase n=1 Tax=Haladaptatus cibarius TaxID=453847 RepID=UPI0006794974|nr:NAD(P)-dependent oxidoreductase [Haladaptatus cibarius]
MSTPTLLLTHRLTPDIASDLQAELDDHLPDGALARARTPEETFELLPDAVLVNIARGDVVDEDALIRALQYRLIRGAGLDVFSTEPLPSDSPLWNLSNAVLTPHMAGSTPHKAERWRDIIVENYEVLASDRVDEMVNRIV